MNSSKPALSLIFSLLLCLSMLSCGKANPPAHIDPLLISTKSPLLNGVINASYTMTFGAIGGVGPYSWSLLSGALPDGLTLNANGTLSGTPTKLQTATFKVQATDSQTPTAAIQSGTFSLTINDVLSVTTTSLTAGTVDIPYNANLAASGGVPPYTWTITAGSLPDGLTMSQYGALTGTPTTAGSSTFTVQVTDSENPAVTASGNISLTINGPNGRLNGNLAFAFSGFNQGNPVMYVGSFVADGQGNISSGVMDYNTTTGPVTNVAITGTYSLDDTGHGSLTLNAGTLGTLTWQVSNSTYGYTIFIQNGNAQDTATRGSGYIKVQTTDSFKLSGLAANWSFGGVGADSGAGRYGAVGYFVLDSKGKMTAGTQDTNDAGSVTAKQTISGSIGTPDATTGRATGTLGASGANFAFYVVNTGEMMAVSTDAVSSQTPLVRFSLLRQGVGSQGFSNAYLNGPSVLQLSGVGTVNGSPAPDATVGVATFDGKGGFTATDDENLGGTLTQNSISSATYSVDSTGRTTTTGIGTTPPVLYLSGFNRGFVLGNDASVLFGTTETQYSGGKAFTNAVFSGTYAGGSVPAVLPSVTVDDGIGTADGASPTGTLTLNYDTSGPSGPIQGQTLTGSYVVDGTTGRFPITVNGTTTGIGYVVSAGRVIVLGTDANPAVDMFQR